MFYKYIEKKKKKTSVLQPTVGAPADSEVRPPPLHHPKLSLPPPCGPGNPSPPGLTPRTLRLLDRSAQRSQTPSARLEEGHLHKQLTLGTWTLLLLQVSHHSASLRNVLTNLEKCIDLSQRGYWESFLFFLHLESLESDDLIRRLLSCPVNDSVGPFFDSVQITKEHHEN